MPVTIRQEQRADIPAVRKLIERAFAHEKHSEQTEHVLVERLRASDAFIPELSLTAVDDGEVIGYILLTKIAVGESVSLALCAGCCPPRPTERGHRYNADNQSAGGRQVPSDFPPSSCSVTRIIIQSSDSSPLPNGESKRHSTFPRRPLWLLNCIRAH